MPLGFWLGFHERLGAAGLWWGLLIALTGAAFALLYFWRRTMRAVAGAAGSGFTSAYPS